MNRNHELRKLMQTPVTYSEEVSHLYERFLGPGATRQLLAAEMFIKRLVRYRGWRNDENWIVHGNFGILKWIPCPKVKHGEQYILRPRIRITFRKCYNFVTEFFRSNESKILLIPIVNRSNVSGNLHGNLGVITKVARYGYVLRQYDPNGDIWSQDAKVLIYLAGKLGAKEITKYNCGFKHRKMCFYSVFKFLASILDKTITIEQLDLDSQVWYNIRKDGYYWEEEAYALYKRREQREFPQVEEGIVGHPEFSDARIDKMRQGKVVEATPEHSKYELRKNVIYID